MVDGCAIRAGSSVFKNKKIKKIVLTENTNPKVSVVRGDNA